MKPYLFLLLGLFLAYVESSLFLVPLLVAWVWFSSRFVSVIYSVWFVFILGIVLDVLLMFPPGRSSLVLLVFLFAYWYERQLFSSSIRADLLFLILTLVIWSVWQKMSLWAIIPVALVIALALRIIEPTESSVILRREQR